MRSFARSFVRSSVRSPSLKCPETEPLLTLLSRTSPLRECFLKEYLAREELVLSSVTVAAVGTDDERAAPELCDAFNFIYIAAEYSFPRRRCAREIPFPSCMRYFRDENFSLATEICAAVILGTIGRQLEVVFFSFLRLR